MKKKYIFIIPLVLVFAFCFLFADNGTTNYPGKQHKDTSRMQTQTAIQDSEMDTDLSYYTLNHYRWIYMKYYQAGIQSSLGSQADIGIIESYAVQLTGKVNFNEMMKFQPTEVNKYMDAYRTGGFFFPFSMKSATPFDEDVIESWEYQKNLMYPYGHTPTDFYQP
jgi:hypothetical protein